MKFTKQTLSLIFLTVTAASAFVNPTTNKVAGPNTVVHHGLTNNLVDSQSHTVPSLSMVRIDMNESLISSL